jgi:DnaJ-class molecular chaperone
MMQDYYAILGLETCADQADIAAACRRMMRKFHPDVSSEPHAEERFKEIVEAGRVLKDAVRRAAYDRQLNRLRDGEAALRRRRCRTVSMRHSGYDIYVDVLLASSDMYAGTTVEVTAPQGRIRIRVPPGSRAGQRLRLRGRGLPRFYGGRGDLLLVLRNADTSEFMHCGRGASGFDGKERRATVRTRRTSVTAGYRPGSFVDSSC